MIRIAQAELAQLDGLVELFDAYRVWYRKSSDKTSARKFLKERLTSKDAVIYIAMNEEKQIGFTQLYPSFSSTRMQRLWILNDLFVEESQRGQGISKSLISAAKQLCKETEACGLLLETEQNNLIGNRLYPAVGFELEKNNFYFWTNKN